MKRRSCVWLSVTIILVIARVGLAECLPTNLLPNPSFEHGLTGPQGWAKFGTAEFNWELGGQDGGRCISITGNGVTAGWWYAIGGEPVKHDRLYRLSYWVRITQPETTRPGEAFVGVDKMILPLTAGPKWERKEVYFRAPSFPAEPGMRFGQKSLKGTVYFDNVAVEPAIAISRPAGVGGGTVGGANGSDVVEGRSYYLALTYRDTTVGGQVEEVADLTPGGRNEIELTVTNAGERRHVEIVVGLERQGKELATARDDAWLAPGSTRRFHLELKIEEAGAETLRIQARDASSGELLFMFEGRLDANAS